MSGTSAPRPTRRAAAWRAELLLDDCDRHFVDEYSLELCKGRRGYRGVYARAFKTRERKVLARLIMDAPNECVVDHINGNPLDNRRANLRLCTQAENNLNRGATKGSFKGVWIDKRYGSWIAQIGHNGKRRHLGSFATPEDAARAYDTAARELHGNFAHLNFPSVAA